MRHSGIEWIGEIPKEWEVMPFKQMYELSKGLSITKSDLVEEGIPVISYGQIHSKTNTGTTIKDELIRYVPDRFLDGNASSLVKKGDVIFADTSEDLDGCGNCVYIDRDNAIFAGYHTIIAKYQSSTPNNYLSYLFKTDCWRSQIRSSVNGVKLFSVPQRLLGSTTIIFPPLSEQQKIANYLDKVCGEVDEMIALQEHMIEELKAYKQSVITEAVTKGLNPDVPMKDSGIDWIGEVPEHWNLHQFRRIFVIKKIIAGTLGYDVLSVTQNGIKVKDLTKNEGQIAQDYSKYQLVDVHDYVMNHMDLLTGYVDCSKQVGVTSPDYRVFRAIDKTQISLSYYLKIFQTCYKEKIFYHLGQGVSGMGRWRLPADQLKLFYLPMPPLSEQQSIASYLDTKCAEIDALIAIKQAKIEELKDYKKSVIYEYVTGKKEVI
ncbi:type I restriction enzyme, S subunit [Prevotella sp. lc2012]|nr:type I restriction enzyme, S subunit [Prevotella sp. lc2012]